MLLFEVPAGYFHVAPMILRANTSPYSKSTQEAILWTATACILDSVPPKWGVSSQEHFQKAHLPLFSQKSPPGEGGVLPPLTEHGTNYLHMTLLQNVYKKPIFWTLERIFFRFSAPKIRRALTKTFSKCSRLIYPFFPKNGPGGGGLPDFSRRGMHTSKIHAQRIRVLTGMRHQSFEHGTGR